MAHTDSNIRFAAKSDRGQVRPTNQDSFYACLAPAQKADTHGHLFVVADGMGGHAAGEIASALAQQTLRQFYYDTALAAGDSPVPILADAFQAANRAILSEGLRDPARYQMGTTCTAAVIRGDDLWIAHIGDSRAYMFRNGKLVQLTHDHNLAETLLQEGKIDSVQAANHKGQHILTRALGTEAHPEPDISSSPTKLQSGDRLLLCSDGLNRVVSDEQITTLITLKEPKAVVSTLVSEANRLGAPDNVSVVLIEMK